MLIGEFVKAVGNGITVSLVDRLIRDGRIVPERDSRGYRIFSNEDVSIALGFMRDYKPFRRYKYNECYFDVIDSADKAYWLGFLWGDGYPSSKGLYISLCLKDQRHLEKFLGCIDGNVPIRCTGDVSGKIHGKDMVTHGTCNLLISSEHLVHTLHTKYGLYPHRNDFSNVIRNVPSVFHRDLIRGLIDSDGCILAPSNDIQSSLVYLISNESVLDFFENYVQGVLDTDFVFSRKSHRSGYTYVRTLYVHGPRKSFYLLDSLYNGSSLYLDRKYDRYMVLYNHFLNHSMIDVDSLSGKGSGTVRKSVLEFREYFRKGR